MIINKRALFALILFSASMIQLGDYAIARYAIPILGILLVSILMLFSSNQKILKVDRDVFWVHLMTLIFFYLIISLNTTNVDEKIFDYVKTGTALLGSFLAWMLFSKLSTKQLHKVLVIGLSVAATISFLEVYIRLDNFNYASFLQNFYRFKLYSPFFYDSNAAGIYSFLSLCLALFGISRGVISVNKYTLMICFVLFVCILLSFSRAALFVAILTIFLYLAERKSLLMVFVSLSTLILLFINFNEILDLISSDGSGNSKIGIYISSLQKISYVDTQTIFFGRGMNEGAYIYSYQDGNYAHALIPMLLGQVGILGLVLYFSFFIFYASRVSRGYLIIFLPIFFIGLSYLHPFLEMIFIVVSISLSIQHSKARPRNV